MRRRKTRQRNERLAERRRGQRQPDPSRILIHRTEPPHRRPSDHGGSPTRPCVGHARGDLRLLRHADRPWRCGLSRAPRAPHRRAARRLPAAVLGALVGSFGERTIGVHGGTESTLRAVALSCGANPSSAQLPVVLADHRSGHARLCKPRHHAFGVRAELRRGGLRIGLLSDCGAELAECWSPTAFVPLVFSWQERCRKPDPRLHAPVARRHAVHRREVLATNALVPGASRYRVDPDDAVCEYMVDDPVSLLPLLGSARPV